jgi:hypothetical protein
MATPSAVVLEKRWVAKVADGVVVEVEPASGQMSPDGPGTADPVAVEPEETPDGPARAGAPPAGVDERAGRAEVRAGEVPKAAPPR